MTEAPPLYNSRVIKNYLEYLERHHPDVSLDDLLSAAGIERVEVEDPGHWFTQAQINDFHNSLGQVVRDPQLARKAGRFSQASRTAGLLTRYVLGFMTPMTAYRAAAKVASEWTRATDYEARVMSARQIALTVTPRTGTQEQPFQCDNRIGMLEALAKLFTGQYADIDHPACIHRGDASCAYRITWHPLPSNRLKRWLRYGLLGSLCVLASTATFLSLRSWLFEMAGWVFALGSGGALAIILDNRELKRQMTRKGEVADRDIQEIKYRYRGAFLIQEIGKAASTLQAPEKLAAEAVALLQKRLGYSGGMLWLMADDPPERLMGCGFGISPDVMKAIREVSLGASGDGLNGLLETVCQRGTVTAVDGSAEIQRRFPGGRVLWEALGVHAFIAAPLRNEDRTIGVLFVYNDAANRRTSFSDINLLSGVASQVALGITSARNHHRLQQSRSLFDAFMENLPALAFIKDRQGRYIYTNPHYGRLFDEPPGHRLGKTDQDLWPDEVGRELMANDRRVLEENCISNFVETTTYHGETQYWQVSKFPLYMEGRLTYLGGVAFDISDRMKTEEAKQELEFRLLQTQKMEAIGTLAGGIAHDFNNILSAIIGFTEMSLMDAPPDSGVTENLEKVLRAGGRARDLVKQILTFSRQSQMDPKPIRLQPIVKEALKLLRASLPTTLSMDAIIEPAGMVMADPTQIHQLIMNLCTNARDAMENVEGTLTVILESVVMGAEEAARYPRLSPGNYSKLTVCDTGQGIPSHIMEKIFDPFFTTKGEGRGTGMGLAVVHGIVERIGGAITVNSTPGEGSCFIIFLPIIEDRPSAVLPASLKVPGGCERILFVDDETFQTDLGCQMLGRLGYRVHAFTRSLEALQTFEADPKAFDLVITDMTMPEMTGDVLARSLLAIRPDLPIILCTGYSERITAEAAEALGIRGFAMKPVIIRELALLVRKILDDIHPD